MIELPVDFLLGEIAKAVSQSPIVIVEAPPGSGKTTRVAPSLLESFAKDGRRVILLQPRRIAVQTVAARIADEMKCSLGQDVGYAIRFDAKYNTSTRLLVSTEGVLSRMLRNDISLSEINVVIFDEFHERSLDSDLLFAICRQIQSTIRPDLRLVVMSATIASQTLSTQLSGVPVLRTEGRMFPVGVRFRPKNSADKLSKSVAATVKEAIGRHDGDALVFLPGKGEIFQTQSTLDSMLGCDCQIVPLFGAMSMEQQNLAVGLHRPEGRRRIILATNIAETSLTIEGIRIVVDSGLARVMRYDPATGLDRLSLEPICRASADQRAGRAGRVAAGVAYRLWSDASHRSRSMYLEPEIHRVDFSAAMLMLYSLKETTIERLPWLDPPHATHVASAERLLEQLDAINGNQLTEIGNQMVRLPLHPRLARLVIEGKRRGILKQAAFAAAMLSERSPFIQRFTNSRELSTTIRNQSKNQDEHVRHSQSRRWPCDVSEQLEAIEHFRVDGQAMTKFGEVQRNMLQTIDRAASQIMSEFDNDSMKLTTDETWLQLRNALFTAFPDRVAKRRQRGQERGLMVGGKGVKLGPESGVVMADLFTCLEVDASMSDAKVRRASAVERDWLTGGNLRTIDELFYSPTHRTIQCRRRTYWIDLLLEESPAPIQDRVEAGRLLAKAALADWKRSLPIDNLELQNLIGRIRLLSSQRPDLALPIVDEARLKSICETISQQITSLDELKTANWAAYVVATLTHEQSVALNRMCPLKITIPSGSRHFAIDYAQLQPMLSIKIQDAFGLIENPRICDGLVVVQMHLLAPNMRTQQITNDLTSFWKNGYEVVKKELKRRYPKHAWPDDPLNARSNKTE